MKARCLPFENVPHATPLFLDFLSGSSRARQFYPFGPRFQASAARITQDANLRTEVAATVEKQNRSFGASQAATANIERFRAGAATVFSGQQVALFGGPFFTLLKAITAVSLAHEATRHGINAVPFFWLAGEDHDLAEVNHVSVLNQSQHLQKISVSTHGSELAQVGGIAFGQEINPAVAELVGALGDNDALTLIRETYRPGETFGSAFAKLMARIFAQSGLVVVDGSDPDLRRLAAPIFKAAIDRSGEITAAILQRGKEIEKAGYTQQVKFTENSTLLFSIESGKRLPIQKVTGSGSGEFKIGGRQISKAALLENIAAHPENFSPNVLLRPVVQDFLFPNLAYAAGPAEIAYFAQVGVVYELLLGRITPVVPRFSATVVSEKAAKIAQRYKIDFNDLMSPLSQLQERMSAATFPSELESAFTSTSNSLETSLKNLQGQLAVLDPTLAPASETSLRKIRYQLSRLRGKAARARLRREEIIDRHAHLLSNSIYPGGALQERALGGITFLSRFGLSLVDQLQRALRPDCLGHQIVEISEREL